MYSIEDVAGTLLYAIQNGDAELSFKCAQELKCSGEDDYLLKTLTLSWLTQEPGRGHYESLIQKDAITFLASLIHEGGYELPPMEEKKVVKPPKPAEDAQCPWQNIPKSWEKSQAAILWKTNEIALKKGHWEKAYRLTFHLLPEDTEAICDMLKAMNLGYLAYLLETTVFLPLAERILKHAFYIASSNKKADKPKHKRNIFEKEGRTFQIPPEALKQWHIKPKPESDLIGCPVIIMKEGTSKYWRDICERFQLTLKKKTFKFKDDESVEKFYELCFPNDIPDEWSTTERNKSHGFKESSKDFVNPWFPAFIMLND